MADTTNTADDNGRDLLQEECVSFAVAARRLPKVRGKKHPSPSTLWRWAKHGRRSQRGNRVYLEYVLIGGTNCTSMEALGRFFAGLNDEERPAASEQGRIVPFPRKTEQTLLSKKAEQATRELRRRGIL